VVTALYRRYRPETFAEMIGQSQVTEPLMTALRSDRVNHAYLFSGPRGCGKTTSARILARCLNCAEGPTDTPCGKCSSCIELGRDGGGSLDVVEIDAASHGGVDDARDLRERAIFAPARDRYKIFILDEAHMVTASGFNALLKIVEEPPEHVKFIFATTEPEKVIGTIRSRTHHYPFRLVPPAQMLEYVQGMCDSEGVKVAPGVLPLVVRAGGGSPRDTLSLLDQLMAGSEGDTIEYARAVALLGYTHAALLDEVIDAIAARDAAGAFGAVDRVIQTGQDPRRFVEDLLERVRDLIVVAATSAEGAAAVLRGVPQDELDHMAMQASKFGAAELSRSADIVNAALTEMTGATSPRLHLELMIARTLIPSSDDTERGALARVERLERRVGVSDAATPGETRVAETGRGADGGRAADGAGRAEPGADRVAGAAGRVAGGADRVAGDAGRAAVGGIETPAAAAQAEAQTSPTASTAETSAVAAPVTATSAPVIPIGDVTTQQIKDAWPQVLDAVQKAKRSAWMVVFTAQVRSYKDDVLTLSFPSDNDVSSFRQQGPGQGVSEYLRQAIVDVLGIRVKFVARADAAATEPTQRGTAPADPALTDPALTDPALTDPAPTNEAAPSAPAKRATQKTSAAQTTSWATIAIPGSDAAQPSESVPSAPPAPSSDPAPSRASAPDGEPPFDEEPPPETEPPFEPEPPSAVRPLQPTQPTAKAQPTGKAEEERAASSVSFQEPQRYGESVVREILGASFIEEQPAPPTGAR
jgi:DNA polymerase-3 subunit gamma/tau